MRIIQSTIERMLYITLLLVFVVAIATYVKVSKDDTRKFKILKNNQETLICIVRGFTVHHTSNEFIDRCVKENQ